MRQELPSKLNSVLKNNGNNSSEQMKKNPNQLLRMLLG